MKRKSEMRGQSSQSRKLTVPAEWSRRGVESQSIQDELMESIELFDDNENSPVYDRIAYNQEDAKQDTSIQSFSDSFDNLPFDPIDPDKVFGTVAADQQQQQQQQYDSSIHSFSDSFDANSRNDSRLPTDNILAGLDQWRPKPDSSQISTQEENYRPDSHQSERQKSPQFVFGSDNVKTEMETDNDDREFYWPEFILPTSSSKSTNHQQEQKVDPKVFVSNGLASTAFNFIEQEKQEYLKWEQRVHAQMAIHGSMVQLYLDNEGVELYRILEMESKYGNIVGRCIRLRQDEIEYLKLQREKAQASRNLDDIEEFSQPAVLPAYEPQDDDQEVSILFSFRFSQMSKAAKDRFLRESLVAVFDKGHQDANIITTKFMAESLH